jgi:serine/threonine protein kinase
MSMIGKSLAHYSITSQLGKGGMGEVYQAKDQKLGRDVAIKVLPQEFAKDADRIARFQREAKLLASLNHPNIAAIYGLEEADGTHFLVLELIEGETLANRIKTSAIPVEESLKLALQIAEALEAAHERGVIHRDLKPANIKVTPDGKVKVLDFGLAKAFAGEQDNLNLSNSPTLSDMATQQGVILGTAAYMSPEQARGKEVDKRVDVWAFGVVLFEMLTGRSLFSGEDVSSTLARVLEREPDFSALPPNLHPRIKLLLERCLKKEPKDRYGVISDARVDIQEVLADPSGVFVRPVTIGKPRNKLRTILPWVAVTVILIIIAGWILLTTRGDEVIRLSVTFPHYLRNVGGMLSPDGQTIVIIGRLRHPENPEDDISRLYTRQLDSSEWKLVPGSENGVSAFVVSSDSRYLAMRVPISPDSGDFQLCKVPLDGGTPPQSLVSWADSWNAPLLWLPDDDLIVITDDQEIVRIPTDGSPPRDPIPIRPDGFTERIYISRRWDSILPDGQHVLGEVQNYSEQGWRHDVVVIDVGTGDARLVLKDAGNPSWSSTGHLLFSRGETIHAVSFDPIELATTGGQVSIIDDLYINQAWQYGGYILTQNGHLMHLPGGLVGQSRKLMWADKDTLQPTEPWSDDLRPFTGALSVSPDGSHLAVQIPDSGGIFDCWLSDVDQPSLRLFIHKPGRDCTPIAFTPDSQELIYSISAEPTWQLYRQRIDGTGERELLLKESSTTESFGVNWFTSDKEHLILTHSYSGGGPDLVLLPLEAGADGSRNTRLLLRDASYGYVSPDGSLLLHQYKASGRWEWYVCTISSDHILGHPFQLTTDGGQMFWRFPGRSDGFHDLFHINNGQAYRVTITVDPDFRIVTRKIISERVLDIIRGRPLLDGRWLYIMQGDDEIVDEVTSVTVVLNWTTELRRRLAASGQ